MRLFSRSTDQQALHPFWRSGIAWFVSALALFVAIWDMFERRKTEHALRESEERYRAFIAQSSEGIWRCELEFPLSIDRPVAEQIDAIYQYGYLAECNDAMAQMYGYERSSDLVGARLNDLLVRSDPANVAYLSAFIQSGYKLLNAESHERDRTGADRFFSNNLIGIVNNGKIMRAWGTQRDITQMKEAQRALELAYTVEQQARSDAEDALHLRDQFLSIAAHELRTPVTSLLGVVQLVRRRVLRELAPDPRHQRSLEMMEQQTQRLATLIDDLLDVSRIQAGQFVLSYGPVDMAGLVRSVVDETQPMLQRHTVVLEAPSEQVMIEGDAVRLEQVLRNLIDNAIKYSPNGGMVTVQLYQQTEQIALSVRDQGIGIPQASRGQLFQRFFRAGNVNTEQIAGMGLGLYVVNEIIMRHGGTITVDSEESQGSTFTVSLPVSGGR